MSTQPDNDEPDVMWLSLDGIFDLGTLVRKHAYSRITDEQIRAALPATAEELLQPWEPLVEAAYNADAGTLSAKILDQLHASRIAGFALLIQREVVLPPIDIEFGESIYVNDGNHRLRAYLYLGMSTFPVSPSGFLYLAY